MNHPDNFNAENAIPLYETNLMNTEHSEIVEKCLKMFSSVTFDILKYVALASAHPDTILTICDLSHLNIHSEIDLLDALHMFAQKQRALPGHNSNGNHVRFTELVQPALAKIRLLTLTNVELLNSSEPCLSRRYPKTL